MEDNIRASPSLFLSPRAWARSHGTCACESKTLTDGEGATEQSQVNLHMLLERYPDRVPTFLKRCPNSTLPELEKQKLMFSANDPVSKLSQHLKGKFKTTSAGGGGKSAIFIYVQDRISVEPSKTIGELYEQYKSPDGMLHLSYTEHNSFGTAL